MLPGSAQGLALALLTLNPSTLALLSRSTKQDGQGRSAFRSYCLMPSIRKANLATLRRFLIVWEHAGCPRDHRRNDRLSPRLRGRFAWGCVKLARGAASLGRGCVISWLSQVHGSLLVPRRRPRGGVTM